MTINADTSKFVNCLSDLWAELPARFKNKITKPEHRAVKAASQCDQTINLPSEFTRLYKQWGVNCPTFLPDGFSLEHRILPLPQLYSYLSSSRSCHAPDRARWRFLSLTLHRLSNYTHSNFEKIFLSNVVNSKLVSDNQLAIKKNLKSWTIAGGKYEKLVQELGIGCLLLLPDNIATSTYVDQNRGSEDLTRSRWEHHFPKSGPKHEEVIKMMVNKIVSAEIPANDIATRLCDFLWELIAAPILEYRQWNGYDARAPRILASQAGGCSTLSFMLPLTFYSVSLDVQSPPSRPARRSQVGRPSSTHRTPVSLHHNTHHGAATRNPVNCLDQDWGRPSVGGTKSTQSIPASDRPSTREATTTTQTIVSSDLSQSWRAATRLSNCPDPATFAQQGTVPSSLDPATFAQQGTVPSSLDPVTFARQGTVPSFLDPATFAQQGPTSCYESFHTNTGDTSYT